MIWWVSKTVLESGSWFGARYWRLVSCCDLGKWSDDALDGSKVKLLDCIVREAAVDRTIEGEGQSGGGEVKSGCEERKLEDML